MATKRTSRRGGGTPAPTPTVSTPRQRPPSPLSPSRTSRVEEKRQMQLLNNRLVSYIEAVRSRDIEINSLKTERSSVEETHTTEVTQIKKLYGTELGQLRRALDGVSKEKAKVEIEAEKGTREAREARTELVAEKKRSSVAEKELNHATKRLGEVEARLKIIEDEVTHLRPDNVKLAKRLEDAKRNLEDETLKRTDLQNQLLSQEEGLKFENSMLEQQLNDTRVRKQIEISEIDGRLNEEYERKMQENLNELRQIYETQAKENKEEFSRVYEDKLAKMQGKLDAERNHQAGNAQEMRELSTKVTALTSKNLELESSNSAMQKRMADLMKEIEDEKAHFRGQMAVKDQEVQNKEEQMAEMLKDYQALSEVKVVLDMEIATYRKILEGEEKRLGLSPAGSPQDSGPRGVKRRRTYIEEEEVCGMVSDHSGLGTVQIEPLEKDAKVIKVTNKSDEEVNIGGWSLSNVSGENESAYKFHRSTTLAPGATCSVCSADSDQEHSPPTTLIMKKGGWVIGSTNKTVLTNKDGTEESTRLSREERAAGSSFRSGYGTARAEEKSCVVM